VRHRARLVDLVHDRGGLGAAACEPLPTYRVALQ
jgi:hypothetical protein